MFTRSDLLLNLDPATGYQTLAWDWSGTNDRQIGSLFGEVFFKRIETDNLIRDSFPGQFGAPSYSTDLLTALSDDLISAAVCDHPEGEGRGPA